MLHIYGSDHAQIDMRRLTTYVVNVGTEDLHSVTPSTACLPPSPTPRKLMGGYRYSCQLGCHARVAFKLRIYTLVAASM